MGLLRRSSGRHSFLDDRGLAITFSHVLHEASDSPAVFAAVRAARSFNGEPRATTSRVLDGNTNTLPDLWLSASLGSHHQLADALQDEIGSTAPIHLIDTGQLPVEQVTFFRAPAALSLPDTKVRCVGVAALIQRPGARSSQLIVRGPFDWPNQQQVLLSHLESIIQAFVGQWQPQAMLWSMPAEIMLPDEVGQTRDAGRGSSAASTSS